MFTPPPRGGIPLGLQYCPNCRRNVNTEHRMNGIIFVILLLILIVPGIVYLVWGWPRRCPICKTPAKMLEAPRFSGERDYAGQENYNR